MKKSHKKRRVFFMLDSFYVGGTETQGVELALRMDPDRYEVTLGCLRREGPLLSRVEDSGIETAEFHPNGGIDSLGGIKQLLRLSWFLRRGSYDIAHTHDLWSNLIGVPAARIAGVPAIICSQRDLSHDHWYRPRRRWLFRRVQRLASVVLVNAAAIRDGLLCEGGLDPMKVRLIYNGVDVTRFEGPAVRDRHLIFSSLGDDKLIVLVGNMRNEVKGHTDLIAAAKMVVQQRPDTRFALVGEGGLREDLERRVAECALTKHFLFLGHRSDIPAILAASDVGVLPSRAEGLPNAVLEYLMAGLPIVATAVGGNVEILDDGRTGLLVPPRDPQALAAALLRILNDGELARRLAKSGRQYVRTNFSFDRLVKEIDSLYTEILRGKNLV